MTTSLSRNPPSRRPYGHSEDKGLAWNLLRTYQILEPWHLFQQSSIDHAIIDLKDSIVSAGAKYIESIKSSVAIARNCITLATRAQVLSEQVVGQTISGEESKAFMDQLNVLTKIGLETCQAVYDEFLRFHSEFHQIANINIPRMIRELKAKPNVVQLDIAQLRVARADVSALMGHINFIVKWWGNKLDALGDSSSRASNTYVTCKALDELIKDFRDYTRQVSYLEDSFPAVAFAVGGANERLARSGGTQTIQRRIEHGDSEEEDIVGCCIIM